MNNRQKLFAAILGAFNAARKNVLDPVTAAFSGLKDDALPEAARPAIAAARSTLCGLVTVELRELPNAPEIEAALDAVVAEGVTAGVAAALPEATRTALNGVLTSGDYVAKADSQAALTAAVTAARAEGEASGRTAALAQVSAQNARRERVTQCGLPVSEAALAGNDAEFEARLTQAQARRGEAAKLTLNGKPLAAHLDVFAEEPIWNAGYTSAKSVHDMAVAAIANLPDGSGGGNGGGNGAPKIA